jgi:CubicO group peptidase (beta-lactamase class C family)
MRIRVPGGVFLAGVVAASCAWLAFYAHGTVARAADKIMEGQVSRGSFSGVVLVSKAGRVLFEHAYGMADTQSHTRNTLDTRFRIGSITKTFTATLVMQLAGEHKLALSDSICSYIAECPPGWTAITLHHLLSHTSGIYNLTSATTGEQPVERMLASRYTPAAIFARFLHQPLAFAPGARFEYSNSNYWLLTRVIEKVTGQSYELLLQRRIFEPAGMHDSGLTHDWSTTPRAAIGYWMSRQGKIERAPVVDGSWSAGDGGIYSTAPDLQKFSDALDNGTLLPRLTLERMRTPVTPEYGYGWSIPKVSPFTLNRRQVGHGGALPGFVSEFQRFEAEKLTVIVLSNSQRADPPQVVRGLASAVFKEPFTPAYERESVELPEAVLQRYAGDYDLEGVIWTLTLRDGHLHARAKDGTSPDLELLAESEDTFFIRGSEVDFTVLENSKGEVDGLALNAPGADRFAKKLR